MYFYTLRVNDQVKADPCYWLNKITWSSNEPAKIHDVNFMRVRLAQLNPTVGDIQGIRVVFLVK